jgi:hypothetical protein
MAANERIDDIIAEKAFAQVERMTAEVNLMLQAMEKVIIADTQLLKITGDTTAGLIKKATKTKEVTAATIETQLQQKKLKDTLTDQQKAVSTAVDAYGKLELAYKTAKRESMNLGVTLGTQSKEYKEVTAKAASYKNQIDSLNKSTGDHTKNVGNYQSALKGLGSQLLAVAGLTGGLTMIVAGFKKAFGDYEEQIKQERGLLNALNGRVDVQKELIKQAFYLQKITGVDDADIISVQKLAAVHGLTAEQIKKVTKASLDWAAVTGNDVNTAAIQLLGTFEGSLARLGRWDKDFKDLSKTELENGGVIDIITEKYKGFAEAAATGSAKAKVAFKEASENLGKMIAPAVISGMNLLARALEKLQPKLAVQNRLDNLKSAMEELTTQELINKRREEAFKLAAKTAELSQPKNVRDVFNKSTANLEKEAAALTNNIAVMDEMIKRRKTAVVENVNFIKGEENQTASIKDNTKAMEENLKAWGDFLNNRITGPKDVQEFTFLSKMVREIETTGNPTLDSFREKIIKTFKPPKDDTVEAWKELFTDVKMMGIETLGAGLSDQISASFENSIGVMREQLDNWHQTQLDQLEERKDKGLITDKQYQVGKEKIEKEYDAKVKAARIKEAQLKKQEALWEIAINTAVAVSKVLAMSGATNWPLVAIAIATGAAQAALVAAQPIPKYAKGRKGGKEEFALVGEAGPEFVKDGSDVQRIDEPTIMKLPAGADVLPMSEIMDLSKRMAFSNIPVFSQPKQQKIDTEIMTDKIVNAIKSKETLHLNITKEGMGLIAESQGGYTQWVNQNIKH